MSAPQAALFEASRGSADLSPCGRYRYRLTREWDASLPRVCWIMLNPSTADADQDDATIRKCIAFSKRWGYGSLVVVNLFAFRSTDPDALPGPIDLRDPRRNEEEITDAANEARAVVCAWGGHAAAIGFGDRISAHLRKSVSLHSLGLTKRGAPRHPLYLPLDTPLVPWDAPSLEAP